MYIEVYLDVVFIINYIMDFIILTILSKWLNKNAPIRRRIWGALLGAFFMCIVVLFPTLTIPRYMFIAYFLISVLMIMITFKTIKAFEVVKLTVFMYLIAIFLGGVMFFMLYYTNLGYFIQYAINEKPINNLSLMQLLLYITFSCLFVGIIYSIVKRTVSNQSKIYDVRLILNEKTTYVSALLDTGNNLFDPITNAPVVIVQRDVMKDFFGEENYHIYEKLSENINGLTMYSNQLKELFGYKLRLIPYTSIGNENGMLVGIVADRIGVKIGKEYKENEKIVLAIYNSDLSKDNSYRMLLHPNLI